MSKVSEALKDDLDAIEVDPEDERFFFEAVVMLEQDLGR